MSRPETVANADSHLLAPVSRGTTMESWKIMATRSPSYKLTFDDAVQVWLRHLNGEFQNRIAAAFDVNQGRINEVLKERTHLGSKAMALSRRAA